jgi:uncharacterized lipoprotein
MFMKLCFKALGITLVALGLSACNLFSGRYSSNSLDAYLASGNGRNIIVPPPLTKSNITNFYRLPDQDEPADISILPPGSKLADDSDNMPSLPPVAASRIHQVDGAIVVDRPMAQTWVLAENAINRESIPLAKTDTRAKTIDIKGVSTTNPNKIYRLNFSLITHTKTKITVSDANNRPVSTESANSLLSRLARGMQKKSGLSLPRFLRIRR